MGPTSCGPGRWSASLERRLALQAGLGIAIVGVSIGIVGAKGRRVYGNS
jgi:hypothetical protein